MRCAANRRCNLLVIPAVVAALALPVRGVRAEDLADFQEPVRAAVDLYGDPLPQGAIARLGTSRHRNPGSYKRVKFVPNTATIAIGSPGGSLRFHDAPTGRLMMEIVFGEAYLQAFDISSDGSTVATLTSLRLGDSREYSTQLELWDAESAERKSTIQWIEPLVEQSQRLAFSPDGSVIATGTRNGSLRFWDAAGGDELDSGAVVERGGLESIAFSPTGQTVAVASRSGAYLWEWTTDEQPQKLEGLDRGAMSVAFSPNGKWLATGSDDGIGCRLFEAESGRLVQRLKGESSRYYIEGLAFDPGGQLLAVPGNTGVEIWDVASGRIVRTLVSERLDMRDVAISSDGQFLVAIASEAKMRVWNLATGEPVGLQLVGHSEAPYEIEFTPDGKRVVTGDTTGVIHVWEAGSGKPLHTLGHERWVSAIEVSPDGRHIVSSGHDEAIRVWDAATGEQIFKLYGHGRLGGKYKLAFAPDGRTFASFGPDMYLRTWDMRTGKCLTEHAIRPQQMFLQEDEDGNIIPDRDLDPFSGGPMRSSGNSQISADASLLLLPHAGELFVFDVQSGRELRSFAVEADPFQRFALSPDGKWLVTAVRQRDAQRPSRTTHLQIIDFATGKVRVDRVLEGSYLRDIQFSPDGSLWAMTGSGGGGDGDQWVSVWSIDPAREVARVPGGAHALAFSPDNSRLASSSEDTSVLVWDLAEFRVATD